MAKIKLSNTKVEQIKAICKEFNNNKGELINVLHKTQGVFGYYLLKFRSNSRRIRRFGSSGLWCSILLFIFHYGSEGRTSH